MTTRRGNYVCLACGDKSNYRCCLGCNSYISQRSGRAWVIGKISQAVRKGIIQPARNFPCADCGGKATEYDHRDYSKPFEVDPVCSSCNKRRGPGKPFWQLLPNDGPGYERRFSLFRESGYAPGMKRMHKLAAGVAA